MKKEVPFCTCTDYKCPMHPTNHDQGCTPCIEKNLELREIPSCFFHKVNSTKEHEDYFFEDFADVVMSEEK